jgi:MFS family permease
MRIRPVDAVWSNANFRLMWSAYTVSTLGSQVTAVALPIVAVLVLRATPLQVGVMTAVQYLPFALIGLPAGIWIDRLPRRQMIIATNFGRAVALLLVPASLLWGPSMLMLYVVALVMGALTVLGDVAHQSYLPTILPTGELSTGNSALTMSSSASQLAGPALGGVLIQMITAPLAVIADSVSYLVSAAILMRIRHQEITPTRDGVSGWRASVEGLRFVLGNKLLRPIVFATAIGNFFDLYGMVQAVLVIYAARELGMSPGQLGVTIGVAGIGALVGAALNQRVVARFGFGPTVLAASAVPGLAVLLLPLAHPATAMPIIMAALGSAGAAVAVYNINQVTLRQAITPPTMYGRMNASVRFLVWGAIPAGAFTGGLLAGVIGVRATLVVAGLGSTLAVLPVLFSALPRVRSIVSVTSSPQISQVVTYG